MKTQRHRSGNAPSKAENLPLKVPNKDPVTHCDFCKMAVVQARAAGPEAGPSAVNPWVCEEGVIGRIYRG